MGTIVNFIAAEIHLLYLTSGIYQPSCTDTSTVCNIWDHSPILPGLWLATKGNITSHVLKWGSSGSRISLIKVNKKHIGTLSYYSYPSACVYRMYAITNYSRANSMLAPAEAGRKAQAIWKEPCLWDCVETDWCLLFCVCVHLFFCLTTRQMGSILKIALQDTLSLKTTNNHVLPYVNITEAKETKGMTVIVTLLAIFLCF